MTIPADRSQPSALKSEWTLWYDKQSKRRGGKSGRTVYEDCIVELGSFACTQGFWAYWNSLNVEHLNNQCNLRIFKKGIKPLWEDPLNVSGGKWVVRGVDASRRKELWTEMVLALVSEEMVGCSDHAVCGAVLSKREGGDSMQLWVDGGEAARRDGTSAALIQQRMSAPSLGALLEQRLFPGGDCSFIYQTHRELQSTRVRPAAEEAEQLPPPPPPVAAQQQAAMQQPLFGAPPMHGALPFDPHGRMAVALPMGSIPVALAGMPAAAAVVPTQVPVACPLQQQPFLPQQEITPIPEPKPAFGVVPSPSSPPCPRSFAPFHEEEQPQDGDAESAEMRAIHDRARQIRNIRKKMRYINFFLSRQCKGRELTAQEKGRVRSLPYLQKEVKALEEEQGRAVELQKQILGVDTVDFLRKRQQPMVYSSEEEWRFKTMRAIRKKIRFIHYHLERQQEGKTLSPAEQVKVASLGELEARLQQLEAEEAAAQADVSRDTDDTDNVDALRAQVEAQRRELEEKQRRIDVLTHTARAQHGVCPLSPSAVAAAHGCCDVYSPSAGAEPPILESPPMSPPLSPGFSPHVLPGSPALRPQ